MVVGIGFAWLLFDTCDLSNFLESIYQKNWSGKMAVSDWNGIMWWWGLLLLVLLLCLVCLWIKMREWLFLSLHITLKSTMIAAEIARNKLHFLSQWLCESSFGKNLGNFWFDRFEFETIRLFKWISTRRSNFFTHPKEEEKFVSLNNEQFLHGNSCYGRDGL